MKINQWTADDYAFMAEAIRLANKGLYTTEPNPRVGCVLVVNQQVVGRGWHQRAGEAHAEIHALQQAGEKALGATAYVSLEPCSHTGRTAPCANALIDAGVSRVVAAMQDPNPLVAGQGLQRLRDAGIVVECGLLADQAAALNPGFIKRMTDQRPLVRIKLAMSVDGRTAMASGESKWITGPQARRDVQRLRARSSAIITANGTILADDAALTVRENELGLPNAAELPLRQPLRVVLDWKAELSGAEKVFSATSQVLYCTVEKSQVAPGLVGAKHIEVLEFPSVVAETHRLKDVLCELANRGCNELLVEAGSTLAGSFVTQGCWDELYVYMAPKLMGSNAMPLLGLPLASMQEALSLTLRDIDRVGEDVRMIFVPNASLQPASGGEQAR